MQRLPGLDTLRALAIASVMLFHSWVVGGMGPHFDPLVRYGWVGVDIFFVLSGFLIGSQVLAPLARGERLALGDFYRRRAYRIVPAFAVVLALYQFAQALCELPGMAPWWQFATFTMNLLIDYRSQPAFSHAWSLCVEEHFYLLFPALAWWATRRPSATRFAGLCAALVLGGIALRASIWLHNEALQPQRPWFIEDLYYPTWTRLDGLLMGVLLAALQVYRPQWWARLQARSTPLLFGGLAVSALAFGLFSDRTGLLANTVGWPLLSLGFGLLVLSASAPRGWLARCAVPGVGWLATISYSLYLSHKIAMHAVHTWIAPALSLQGPALFAVHAAVIVGVGAALHYLVERPGLQWRDRLRPRSFANDPLRPRPAR